MATPIPENRADFTAGEIAFATGGVLVSGAPDARVLGVTTDSRAVRSGNLFVALRGETMDGHRFVDAASKSGAALLVAHGTNVPEGATAIAVDDTLAALGALARFHRRRWGGIVIGITGSAGKTTTKELTAAAVAAALGDDAVLATRGNLNNRIGVPMTLFCAEEQQVAVVEMGTSVRGEIAALAEIAEPDVGVLVSVGIAHAEGLAGAPRREGEPSWVGRASGREAVAREKSAIVSGAHVAAVVNGDDAWATATAVLSRGRTLRFGRSRDAQVRLVESTFDAEGRARVVVDRPSGRMDFALPLFGDVAALDVCAAIAAADVACELLEHAPISAAALEASLARRVRAVPGRLALRRRRDGAWVIDDTYNASPDAFRASIEVARALAERSGRRLVIAAGEMRELGAWAENAHDEVGAAIAAANPALLITLGGLADRYRASGETLRFASAREAAAAADRIHEGDVVLVKASRGVTAELFVDAILARGGEMADGGAQDTKGTRG